MKLATFARGDGSQALGAVVGDTLLDLAGAAPGNPAFSSMLALIAAGPVALAAARELADRAERAERAAKQEADPEIARHLIPSARARLLAPIPRPAKNVFCVGLNFRSHVEQNAIALGQPIEIPDIPLFFSKPATAVTGPDTPIRLDERLTSKLDWEVELTMVIAAGGTWIAEDEAKRHIFGYTIANDVSARDLQWRTSQFLYGKGQDTYCPLGPVIVTADEVPDLDDIELELLVNGEVMQRESAGHMLFRPERVIAELSKGITLEPGDVITLGTPGGCGYQMVPPRFLKPGDVVECRATGIGSLVNTVV
jgi:2-keto-4-pentenoate hydratase/2-oxohepta-3-ene-1,7-dioic acid hydratase in catechol pathway